MKILWLCNIRFSNEKIRESGTWLQPLAQGLIENGDVELYTIAESRETKEIVFEDVKGIHQYVIPWRKRRRYLQCLPSKKSVEDVTNILNIVKPDLVHVWGTESIWAYMNISNCFEGYKILLEIQGLTSSCYRYYYGGINWLERLKTISIEEVLRPWKSIYFNKLQFLRRGHVEVKSIRSFDNISYQSDWVKNEVEKITNNARLHSTKILLREAFYSANPWSEYPHDGRAIFTVFAGVTPYKGLDVLLKALTVLKNNYPNVELRIAGKVQDSKSGLTKYYTDKISKYGIKGNVTFLGPLNDCELINELQQANVAVIPSFVESYCLAFAEAMMVGTPTVSSTAAALPTLADNNKEALFYSPKDYNDCARKIEVLLKDRELANTISHNCRCRRFKENDKKLVIETQYSIYSDIINT